MSFLEAVVFVLEMVGTVAFSISGGLIGIERGLDYFGIPVLSMTTAVGGGMIRDAVAALPIRKFCGERKICQLYGIDFLF